MVAMGIVPTAKAGRRRCQRAFFRTSKFPVTMLLKITELERKFIAKRGRPVKSPIFQTVASGVSERPGVSRPDGGMKKGVPFNKSEKTYANINPNQKTGIETPI